jgi:hypothetical protein
MHGTSDERVMTWHELHKRSIHSRLIVDSIFPDSVPLELQHFTRKSRFFVQNSLGISPNWLKNAGEGIRTPIYQ